LAAPSSPTVAVASARLESPWKLGGLTPLRLAFRVVRAAWQDDLISRASGLAFDFILAFFPLMVFILAVFGLFTARDAQLQGNLLAYFAVLLPPKVFALFNIVFNDLAANSSGGKLTFGIVAGLWFASSGMNSIISTLNVVYRVREARSWFRVRVVAFALTLAMAILLLAALLLVLVGSHAVDWLAAEFSWSSFLALAWKNLRWPAAVLSALISFSLIYYCGPNLAKQRRRWITPGSLFGTLLWLASSAGLRIYMQFWNGYTATYGSLGGVIVILVWCQVSGLAFLVGGEINAEIERAAAGD
jgi:membrane protein